MQVQGQLQLRVNIIFDPERDEINLKLIFFVCLLVKHGHDSPVSKTINEYYSVVFSTSVTSSLRNRI